MVFYEIWIDHEFINAGQSQGRNEFVIRLQPSEAMYMKLTVKYIQFSLVFFIIFAFDAGFIFFAQVKKPGLEMSTIQSELDLSYMQRYQGVTIPEAYERLILDTWDPRASIQFYLKSIF